jgi:hypothetical protein
MTTGLPPTQQFTGIFYNPLFWTSATTSLTQDTANTLYLRKTTPDTATALETFSAGLSTQTATSPSLTTDVTLFQSQTAGTIRVGPNAGAISVHLSNIDCNNNTINNATSPAVGNILIGNSQTTGTISIGAGGSRTSAGTITIGAALNTINLGGYLTPTYTTMPSVNTQIGYKLSTGLTNTTVGTSATIIAGTFPTIPAGVWLIQGYATLPVAAGVVVHLTINNSTAINTGAVNSAPTNASNNSYVSVSVVQQFSASTSSWGLYAQASSASTALTNLSIVITRIA